MKVVSVTSEAHWHQLRAKNVGGSDCAALFGKSPYTTRYMLWHVKNGTLPAEDFGENECPHRARESPLGVQEVEHRSP